MAIPCKKASYKDKERAVKALHLIINSDDGRKKPIRTYRCDRCGRWHLTSKEIDKALNTGYKLKLDWSKLWKPE